MSCDLTDAEKCGWNDMAHGVLSWCGSDRWQGPLEWALYCRGIAETCGQDYHRGFVKAVDHYQKTGRIERQERTRNL